MLTITAVGAVLAATAVVVTSSPATAAPTTTTLRSGDLDYSQSRSAGHNVIEGTALHVYTDDSTSNAKAAGYFPLNRSLASIVATGEPTLNWTGTSPAPGNQLVADFDGDGVADGILVGESVYNGDWWLTNGSQQFVKDGAPSHEGGSGSTNHGTLAQWQTAFKDTTVLQGGYSLGSGVKGDGAIDKLTYGDATINFTNSSPSTDLRHVGDMDFSDTRTAGHNKFLVDSLHVLTDDATTNAKAAGFFPVNLPLADVGEPSMDWTPTAPGDKVRPGTQLRVDFNGDGSFDGALVGEPVYGHDWWTPDSAKLFVRNRAPLHTGGTGSANHGTIDQWRVAFPKARVLTGGYSLGSGLKGDGTISAINIGTVAHTFANSSPTASNQSVSVAHNHAIAITLASTDANGDTVTYTHGAASHGNVTGTGANLSYTSTDPYVGSDSFTYTADDGISAPTTGTVTIDVTNTAPPAPDMSVTVAHNQAKAITLVSTDANGDPVTFSNTDAHHGTVTRDGADVTYTSTDPYVGPDTFTYTANDGTSETTTGTVTIDVTNSAPTAPHESVTTTAGNPVAVPLHSTDADNDPVTYTFTNPSHGTLSGTAPNQKYTPTGYYVGADSFTYTAHDGTSQTKTGTVSVTVNKVVSKTTMVVTQNAPRAARWVRIKATVVARGAHIDTALMTIKDGTKTIGTARLANGQINVVFTNIRAGTHTLYVYFPGSGSSTPSHASYTLRVNG